MIRRQKFFSLACKRRRTFTSNPYILQNITPKTRQKWALKKPKLLKINNLGFYKVGVTGFEPATAWSQTRSATGLRYTPNAFLLEMRVQIYGLVLEQANFEEVFYGVFGNKDEIGSLHATPFGAAWT